jgi:hypothetical protein
LFRPDWLLEEIDDKSMTKKRGKFMLLFVAMDLLWFPTASREYLAAGSRKAA